MNISKVDIQLTDQDILSIIEDYLIVPGLSIEQLEIGKVIRIIGNYKKVVKIPFCVEVQYIDVIENVLVFNIKAFKLGKIKIFNWIKKMALNTLLKNFEENGIRLKGEDVYIDINKILNKTQLGISFNIGQLMIDVSKVEIQVVNFKLSMKNSKIKSEEKLSCDDNVQIDVKEEIKEVHKCEDKYSKLRERLEERIPEKYESIAEYIMIMPDIIALFYRLFRDKRVPIKTKILVATILGYLVSPINLIPNFIPFVGEIDDLALAFYGLNKVINELPENIILDNWQGKENIILTVREGINYIYKIAGGANVGRLVQSVKRIINTDSASSSGTISKSQ